MNRYSPAVDLDPFSFNDSFNAEDSMWQDAARFHSEYDQYSLNNGIPILTILHIRTSLMAFSEIRAA